MYQVSYIILYFVGYLLLCRYVVFYTVVYLVPGMLYLMLWVLITSGSTETIEGEIGRYGEPSETHRVGASAHLRPPRSTRTGRRCSCRRDGEHHSSSRLHFLFHFFLIIFCVSSLLDTAWFRLPSFLPPDTCINFYRAQGSNIPIARRFASDFANSRSRAFFGDETRS